MPGEKRETPKIERKRYPLEIESVERKEGEGGSEFGMIEGYASTWDPDQVGDTIQRGAFARTLDHWQRKADRHRIPVLWQHFHDEPIGATVEAFEDDRGLRIKARLLLGISKARDAYEAAMAKILGGLSIGFSIPRNGEEWHEDGTRTIREVRLFEYSLVTWPANEAAVLTGVKGLGVYAELLEEIRGLRGDFASAAADMRTMRKALLLGEAAGDSLDTKARDSLDPSTLLAEARQLRADFSRGE